MPGELEELQKAVKQVREGRNRPRRLDWLRLLTRLTRLAMAAGILIVLYVAGSALWPHKDKIRTAAEDLLRPRPPASGPASQPAPLPIITIGVPASAPQRSLPSQPTEPNGKTTPKVFKPGDIFALGTWEYCVNAATWEELLKPAIDKTVWPSPGQRFLVVHLTVCNMGEETALSPVPRLVGPGGTKHGPAPAISNPAADDPLSPDRHYRRQVVFDVPAGKPYKLLLSGGWMSDRQAVVEIGQ